MKLSEKITTSHLWCAIACILCSAFFYCVAGMKVNIVPSIFLSAVIMAYPDRGPSGKPKWDFFLAGILGALAFQLISLL